MNKPNAPKKFAGTVLIAVHTTCPTALETTHCYTTGPAVKAPTPAPVIRTPEDFARVTNAPKFQTRQALVPASKAVSLPSAFSRIRKAWRTDECTPLTAAQLQALYHHVVSLCGDLAPSSAADLGRWASHVPSGARRPFLGGSAKTDRTESYHGSLNRIVYLLPHTLAGLSSLCPWATPECKASCLFSAGQGRMEIAQLAKLQKTIRLYIDPVAVKYQVARSIRREARKAAALGVDLAVRLDGTSDLGLAEFIAPLFEDSPHVVFYDYTKSESRALRQASNPLWSVTLSAKNPQHAAAVIAGGFKGSVALVVRSKERPDNKAAAYATAKALVKGGTLFGAVAVVDGSVSDARYTDPVGSLVILPACGMALGTEPNAFCYEV